MKFVALILCVCASIACYEDTQEDLRKHYGLSSYEACKEYEKVFKCLTACKSIGYQIFRMDNHCKCTCHEMKTSTMMPFFMWRTNGTTRQLPLLHSPSLYEVVGTLFPDTTPTSSEVETTTGSVETSSPENKADDKPGDDDDNGDKTSIGDSSPDASTPSAAADTTAADVADTTVAADTTDAAADAAE